MNRTIVFVIFIAAGIASLRTADALNSSKLVKFGTETVALFDGVKSPDGRYAVGWTIRSKSKDAKPVDWSTWNPNSRLTFYSRYDFLDGPYEVEDCFVDLQQNKTLILPSEWAYWPGKNHGSFDAAWYLASSGKLKYALLQNEARFSTVNLWLIVIDETGMHQLDLVPRLEQPVTEFLKKEKVADYDRYAIRYPLHCSQYDASKDAKEITTFKGSSAGIPFLAEIPKSMDAPAILGTVTVSLPDGAVGQVTGSQPPQATSNTSYGLVGGSDEPAESRPEPAVSHETHTLNTVFDHGPYADYNHYSQRQILRRAQRKLRKAGLYHGGIDGAMGPGTQAAIVRWQEKENILVTGLLDHQTLQSMYLLGLAEQTPPRERVYKGEPVREYPPAPDPAEVISRVLPWIPH
jgi:Putative peptidoglycan binding domain